MPLGEIKSIRLAKRGENVEKSKQVKLKEIDFLNKFPNVLLFGNGLSINAGGIKTDKLIDDLWNNGKVLKKDLENEPFPMQIIIATNDNVDNACADISKRMIDDAFYKGKDLSLINRYMNLGFDAYLTTNYSYEAEHSLTQDYEKYKVHTSSVNRNEGKYFLHSFYRIPNDTSYTDIWHIHGEARNKSSIVIGQYYYGNLVHRYIDYLKKQKRFAYVDENEKIVPKSWIDFFIFGNVYIVGISLSFSEFDLWWLLNRKKRETYRHGKVYYFKSKKDNMDKQLQNMLELYDVEIIEDKSETDINDEKYYDKFYKWVYNYLKEIQEDK